MTRLILFTSLSLIACGSTQTSASGSYSGPNELDFLVTAPVRRQMPPERHRGRATVISNVGPALTLEITMFEGGEPCRINATRGTGVGSFTVDAGQECSSRFVYEGSPTAARVSIHDGTVALEGETIEIEMRGEFVAAQSAAGGPTELEGVAHWTLRGRR